jgi:hypothetical protein
MSPEESAEYRARQDAVIAAGVIQIRKEQEELVRLGIIDADGNLTKPFVPPPGQSGLHNEAD